MSQSNSDINKAIAKLLRADESQLYEELDVRAPPWIRILRSRAIATRR